MFVSNASSHLAAVPLGVLRESELTEQTSSIRRGCCLPDAWCSERASTDHHSPDSYSSDRLEEERTHTRRHLALQVDSRQTTRARQAERRKSGLKHEKKSRRVQRTTALATSAASIAATIVFSVFHDTHTRACLPFLLFSQRHSSSRLLLYSLAASPACTTLRCVNFAEGARRWERAPLGR